MDRHDARDLEIRTDRLGDAREQAARFEIVEEFC